jgi:hypothetical protein
MTVNNCCGGGLQPPIHHPSVASLLRYFEYAHLPLRLQVASQPIGDLAKTMAALLPDGPEKTTGLRKLLEAKDCFVRAALDIPGESPT